jgi:Sensors of blue-light using FAD
MQIKTPGNGRLLRIVFACEIAETLSPEDLASVHRTHSSLADRKEITGLFLKQGRLLCVLLEGPEDRVLTCVEGIATDRRHKRLNVLREDPILERRFSSCSFCDLPESARQSSAMGLPREFAEIIARRL